MKHPSMFAGLHTVAAAFFLLPLSAGTALAFDTAPAGVILTVGQKAKVKITGRPASTKILVESVQVFSSGGVLHNLSLPVEGSGGVEVELTGFLPGDYTVSFIGKNQYQLPAQSNVSGIVSVIVLSSANTSAQNPFIVKAGDPVNTATGEYYGTEAIDLNLGGPMPLTFSRYVASNLAGDGLVQAALGANRSHNFASRIIFPAEAPNVKRVVLPSGKVLRFDKVGTKWVLKSPLDVPFQLVEVTGTFLLGDPNTKQIWTYDNTGKLTKIEDGKGNIHTLTYTGTKLTSVSDGLGRTINISQPVSTISSVTGVTGAESRAVTFGYTSGVLTSATDYGTHVTTYGSSAGLPTSITRPLGNQLFTQTYTGGKVTSQTERGTDTSTLAYGTNTTTFTDPTGETLVDNYDANGSVISHVDEAGNSVTMTYDSAGRQNGVTDRNGNKTTILYHALSGLPATITNVEGKVTSFSYKARTLSGIVFQDLAKITYPDGASRSYTYDAKGNVTQITDEAGKAWKYTHNAKGQILTATNPLGGVTTNTYDSAGNLATSQPPDSGTTTFTYDARHRLTLVTRPGGATVSLAYDTKDRLTALTDERGKIHQYTYDNNDRLTVATDPDTETTVFGHDVLDRATSITDRLAKESKLTFDSRHLVSSVTDRNNNEVSLIYDDRRRLASLTDPDGKQWTFTYDDEGRLTSANTPLDPPSQWKLNKLGYPVRIIDPLGNTTILSRDPMQRATQIFDPIGRLTTYAYDKRGLLISATEQGTGTAKYDRDGLGNVTKITDPGGGTWGMAYQKSGRLAKVTDPLGKSTSALYDARGRPATVTFPDATTCTLAYDAGSNITSAAFSSGLNLTYSHDNLGRLASTNDVSFEYDVEGRITNCEQNTHDFTATYDDGGRLVTVSYFDGSFTVTYGYDTRNRLTSVTDSEGTSITMGYDDAGRLVSQTRTPGIDGTYVYDPAGRLTQIQEGGIVNLSYGLNPASEVVDLDITAPTLPSLAASTQTLKFGKAGEIITPGHTYDLLGRLTAAPGGRTYQWDGASRLTNVSGVTLAYNGLGDIITRTEAAQTTRFYHHYALGRAPIVYEDLPAGADRAYVWTPGGKLLYCVDLSTGDPTFYHFDRMGSTLALTDSAGTVTDSYAYGPYGELLGRASLATSTSSQPFTFVGAFGVRTEGLLYHMRARYYDPASVRFLSRDPLPPRLSDPKSTNCYAYAAQNPLRYLDPTGKIDEVSAFAHSVENTMKRNNLRGSGFFWLAYLFGLQDEKNAADAAVDSAVRAKASEIQMASLTAMLAAAAPPPSPVGGNVIVGESGSGKPALGGGPSPFASGLFDPFGPGFSGGVSVAASDLNGSGGGGLFDSFGPSFSGGIRVAAGDFNGSGEPQIIANGVGGGGIFNAGAQQIANSTIACNNADPAPVQQSAQSIAAANAVARQHFEFLYRLFKQLEDNLLASMNKGLEGTEAEVRAYEELKKQRKAFGKIIKKLGGEVPE